MLWASVWSGASGQPSGFPPPGHRALLPSRQTPRLTRSQLSRLTSRHLIWEGAGGGWWWSGRAKATGQTLQTPLSHVSSPHSTDSGRGRAAMCASCASAACQFICIYVLRGWKMPLCWDQILWYRGTHLEVVFIKVEDEFLMSNHAQLSWDAHGSYTCWPKAMFVLDLCVSVWFSTSSSLSLAIVFTTNFTAIQPLLTPEKYTKLEQHIVYFPRKLHFPPVKLQPQTVHGNTLVHTWSIDKKNKKAYNRGKIFFSLRLWYHCDYYTAVFIEMDDSQLSFRFSLIQSV